MSGTTKVLICHNCAGFGYTLGPVMVAVCGDDERTGMTAAGASDTPEVTGRETRVYECGACSGSGYHVV